MATPAAPVALGLSITGILAAAPMGISIETIALGTCFAIAGMLGRFAFDIQKALEGGTKVSLSQAVGWVASGFVGAPFLTIVWVMLLRAVGAQTDIATVLGLLFLGFTGSKGVTWMMSLVGDTLGKLLPGKPSPPK